MWFSIEVMDGASAAALWAEAHGDAVVESALISGASDWEWHRLTWGVVLELAFEDEAAWERFLTIASVTAALDGVPDPVSGLIIYNGRGGSAGLSTPRRPKPMAGAGAAELPLPWLFDDSWTELVGWSHFVGDRRPLLGSLNFAP